MGSLIRYIFGQSNPFMRTFADGADGGGAGGGSGDGGSATGAGDGSSAGAGAGSQDAGGAGEFSWKGQLASDFANSPTIQQKPEGRDGLNAFVKDHLELERLLGTEKVPIPKGPEDVEGWNRFAKAMGVPDKAEQYGIPDVNVPEDMKGLSFNKQEFAEIAHSLKLTPGQTKALWETYTGKSMEYYKNVITERQKETTQAINRLRGEWGDAYDTNVELGQLVINKFAPDQDAKDFITSSMVSDPRGIKFLSQIGQQFAENKFGEFSIKRFSLTPDEAQAEIDKIVSDPQHPYMNDKATGAERERAIEYVNSLYKVLAKAKG